MRTGLGRGELPQRTPAAKDACRKRGPPRDAGRATRGGPSLRRRGPETIATTPAELRLRRRVRRPREMEKRTLPEELASRRPGGDSAPAASTHWA